MPRRSRLTRKPAASPEGRGVIALGLHQAVEYLLAAGLVVTGLHLSGRAMAVLVAAGAVLVVVAAATDAGLGAGRLISRGAHRHADRVMIVVLLALAAVSGDGVAALVLAATAFALWRVSALTRFEPRPEQSASLAAARVAGRSLARANARRAAAAPAGRTRPPDLRIAARAVGRMVGSRRRGG